MAEQMIKVTIKISSSTPFEIEISKDWSVLQVKELCTEKSNIPVTQQRLIYKGKILKDDDKVQSYDIQNGHTLHLVKSQSSTGTSSSSRPTILGSNFPNQSAPSYTIHFSAEGPAASGTNPQVTTSSSFTYSTDHSSSGPRPNDIFSGMGAFPFVGGTNQNPGEMPDISQFMNMFAGGFGNNNPNPDQGQGQVPGQGMFNNNTLNSMMRTMLSNPNLMRSMITPETLQAGQQLAMAMMQSNAGQPNANTNNNQGQTPAASSGQSNPTNAGNMPFNPFAFYQPGMFMAMPPNNPAAYTQTNTSNPAAPAGTNTNPSDSTTSNNTSQGGNTANPFPAFNQSAGVFNMPFDPGMVQNAVREIGQNPQLISTIMSAMNPAFNDNLNNQNDGNTPSDPTNGMNLPNIQAFSRMFSQNANFNSPPEERYSHQLRSLQEMGFIDAAANIQALQETGGDVNAAITRLLERGIGN